MKCEECLALLEEYTDGELDVRTARLLTTHISACMACERAWKELRCEQEMYAGYQREVDVSPALWAAVQGRIEDERAVGSGQWAVGSGQKAAFGFSLARLREWLSGGTNALGIRHAIVAALAFVVIGTIAGMMRYVDWQGREPSREVVTQNESQKNTQTAVDPDKLVAAQGPKEQVAEKKNRENTERQADSRQSVNEGKRSNTLLAARDKRIKRVNPKPLAPSADRVSDELITKADQEYKAAFSTIADAYRREREQLPGPATETARHVERAELLLRSFRNADLSSTAFDLAYEQQHSKKLLYKNISLRRDAAAKGDAPTEELLGSLEPILLDIANLPNDPSPEDVRAVVERMQRKEMVAALQVHSMQTSRMNY
ncbi:MAG: zf-HC2 domain-containing protein [Pyrinomonadaceae bacterium]|nr:zf-HC2 domain-containing protein [Pyrinomonadaceae bacterium]